MRQEVCSAVNFLTSLIKHKYEDHERVQIFSEILEEIIYQHYAKHWFPDNPHKGSGYRCLRISQQNIDPLISRAAAACGFTFKNLRDFLPKELAVWVNPFEVSYRIGEEFGSICILYEAENIVNKMTVETGRGDVDYFDTSYLNEFTCIPYNNSPTNFLYGAYSVVSTA